MLTMMIQSRPMSTATLAISSDSEQALNVRHQLNSEIEDVLLIYFEQIVFFLCNDLYNSAILQMNNPAKKIYSRTASDASD